jgi:hypothetical protein
MRKGGSRIGLSTACQVIRVSRSCRCEFEIPMVRGRIADEAGL